MTMDLINILTKIASEGGVVTIMALILLAGVYAIVNKFMVFTKELAEQHQELWSQMQKQMAEHTNALHLLTQTMTLTEERLRGEMKGLRREMELLSQRTNLPK